MVPGEQDPGPRGLTDDDDEGYASLDCADSANQHDVHPFFDRPSWLDGYGRGYEEGRLEGEHLAEQALRGELRRGLAMLRSDVRLQLRHDLRTPLEVLDALAGLLADTAPLAGEGRGYG